MNPTAFWKSVETWAGRRWPLLSALGYALAFAILFGGVALAAYTSDFAGPVIALACGAVAVWLVKLYARLVRPVQRLIDRLHPPEPGEAATPGTVPGWAFAVYMFSSWKRASARVHGPITRQSVPGSGLRRLSG